MSAGGMDTSGLHMIATGEGYASHVTEDDKARFQRKLLAEIGRAAEEHDRAHRQSLRAKRAKMQEAMREDT